MAITEQQRPEPVEALAALVLTISDGVASGTREDRSGAVVEERLAALGFRAERQTVADEPTEIARIVAGAADEGIRLVVTSGGTGVSPRDRTPEALSGIVDFVVPGFGEAMRAEGRSHTPLASLSRSFGAVRGRTLILCLPGSPSGAAESLDAVGMLIAHTLETLAGRSSHAAPSAPADDARDG